MPELGAGRSYAHEMRYTPAPRGSEPTNPQCEAGNAHATFGFGDGAVLLGSRPTHTVNTRAKSAVQIYCALALLVGHDRAQE